jgi:hypothetical protein
MTQDVDKRPHCERDTETEGHEGIVVTPEMIRVGVREFVMSDRRFESEDEIVTRIFLAMCGASAVVA